MIFESTSGRAYQSGVVKSLAFAAICTVSAMNSAGVAALDQEHNFDSGKLTMNCSGNCPKVTTKYVRRGKYAIESTVSSSTKNTFRTEAVIPGTAKYMQFDRDYWIGFSIYLPSGWRVPNNMEILAQIHRSTTGGGQPPFAI
ncbi:MAG: heparin lyase I family protein, partial [Halieaceae bacterium]|nr:heparin lyase I family protein [Halieaceae bacterium]